MINNYYFCIHFNFSYIAAQFIGCINLIPMKFLQWTLDSVCTEAVCNLKKL